SFRFDGLISRTPPGHTQMLVHFTGFQQDENTLYDDCLFVVDIEKQSAPASRGALQFFGPTGTVTLTDGKASIPFKWVLYYVSQIQVTCPQQKTPLLTPKYVGGKPLAYDHGTI